MDIFKRMKASTPQEKRLLETLLFLLSVLLILVPLYFIFSLTNLTPVQVAVASQVSTVLTGMGFDVNQIGYSLFISGGEPYSFYISPDSTGWKSLIFLFSLILVTRRVVWRKKLIGLAIGLPILWLGNLFRVVSLVVTEQKYGLATATTLHDVYWPIGLVLLLFVVWFVWFRWAQK